jgi:hypothetical protein
MFLTTRKFFHILMVSLIFVTLLATPQSAAATTDYLPCARVYNRYNAEKGEYYASTAEIYPNVTGYHCYHVVVTIWAGGVRRAYGSSNSGFVQRFWYNDVYGCDALSFHEAWQTNGVHWARNLMGYCFLP